MIIDFGTAREFKERSIEDTACLGTQGYAAPEQYAGMGRRMPGQIFIHWGQPCIIC